MSEWPGQRVPAQREGFLFWQQHESQSGHKPSLPGDHSHNRTQVSVGTTTNTSTILDVCYYRDTTGCYQLGRGGLKTFLTIDLTVLDNCGLDYNSVSLSSLSLPLTPPSHSGHGGENCPGGRPS